MLSADALRAVAALVEAEAREEDRAALLRALARSLVPGPIEREAERQRR